MHKWLHILVVTILVSIGMLAVSLSISWEADTSAEVSKGYQDVGRIRDKRVADDDYDYDDDYNYDDDDDEDYNYDEYEEEDEEEEEEEANDDVDDDSLVTTVTTNEIITEFYNVLDGAVGEGSPLEAAEVKALLINDIGKMSPTYFVGIYSAIKAHLTELGVDFTSLDCGTCAADDSLQNTLVTKYKAMLDPDLKAALLKIYQGMQGSTIAQDARTQCPRALSPVFQADDMQVIQNAENADAENFKNEVNWIARITTALETTNPVARDLMREEINYFLEKFVTNVLENKQTELNGDYYTDELVSCLHPRTLTVAKFRYEKDKDVRKLMTQESKSYRKRKSLKRKHDSLVKKEERKRKAAEKKAARKAAAEARKQARLAKKKKG